ncbi:MAG: hypothetical protein ABF780_05005 [Bifidobacterium aquikefiri]|uniref:Uncharacterized protein n=1 Tax=Bifidobacterium aquikefiri TaxID=1653207 RepID=A0A261G3N3_9BIFI|nr:hypothetical protein [Bifidobacterium aquikefiri]OZG66027.1 hypothetical protein BAQU_1361 [Bifidobacterium aquikefiri]
MHGIGFGCVPLCLDYSDKEMILRDCQEVAKLFDGLPPAPQVVPTVSVPTRRKRYWKAEEDEFIRRQYAAGVTITEIARQLASNRWTIKKQIEQLSCERKNDKKDNRISGSIAQIEWSDNSLHLG